MLGVHMIGTPHPTRECGYPCKFTVALSSGRAPEGMYTNLRPGSPCGYSNTTLPDGVPPGAMLPTVIAFGISGAERLSLCTPLESCILNVTGLRLISPLQVLVTVTLARANAFPTWGLGAFMGGT